VTVTNGGLKQEKTALVGANNRLTIAEWNVENLDPSDTKFGELARIFDEHLRRPDVVALQEIQDNNGATNDSVTAATLTAAKLIAAIHAKTGIMYSYADVPPADDSSGGEPGGNIRPGYLYNTARVSLVPGSLRALQDTALTPTDAFANSRKPLAADFSFNNQNITLINVHSSSKSGSTSLYGAPQPATNGSESSRIAQATEIRAVVDGILQVNPNAKLAVLGDFNEFSWNASQQVLTGGTTPALYDLDTLKPSGERYTYIFDGNSQALDHTLVTLALRRLSEHDTVHVNSEFTDAVRTSDHDPSVTRVKLANLGVPETPSFTSGPANATRSYLMQAGSTVGGGDGADLLIGGAGTGGLTGGAGTDLFAFVNGAGVGAITITDFLPGTDQLTLQGFAANAVSTVLAGQFFSGGATNLTLPDGTMVILPGVTSLNSSHFV
jgi:endonuclease/exonuclease/phosphatase family metal-dependent hydrolase